MHALIDLRRRIRSVRNTQQMTQAMKTVATAKLKKAQRPLMEARPYWHSFPPFLFELAFWAGRYVHPLLMRREEKTADCLILTSDKGLCGAFNSNLLERALAFLEEKAVKADIRLILMGKKAVTFFKHRPFPLRRVYSGNIDRLTSEELRELAQFLTQLYAYGQTDAVYLIYNEFKSILAPRITIEKILPIEFPEESRIHEGLTPDWEPEIESIFVTLLPRYVENQILHSFFESTASEHASRMMAMENATKNAEELIGDLTLVLNKVRQASITKELLEIMTAVEALAGK
ncbi:MAG: ATP synthase F1 subunit gamma [Candidatus Aminicenantales bacterium]